MAMWLNVRVVRGLPDLAQFSVQVGYHSCWGGTSDDVCATMPKHAALVTTLGHVAIRVGPMANAAGP